jgi:hypothetical protein
MINGIHHCPQSVVRGDRFKGSNGNRSTASTRRDEVSADSGEKERRASLFVGGCGERRSFLVKEQVSDDGQTLGAG